MKLLTEDDVFGGSDLLPAIKKVFAQSSLRKPLNYSGIGDKQVTEIKRAIKDITKDKSIDQYLAIKAMSYGLNNDNNPALMYVNYLCTQFDTGCYKFTDRVNYLLDQIIGKQISVIYDFPETRKNQTAKYLYNKSLYERSDEDFKYTVIAFDTIGHKDKLKKYFTERNGTVTVDVSSIKVAENFFDEKVGNSNPNYGDKGGEDSFGDYYGDTVTINAPIDIKYFYEGKVEAETKPIIPAGIQGTDSEERTIWNYMELWSNDYGKENKESKKRGPLDKTKMKKQIDKIMSNKNLSDEEKSELIQTLIDLSK